MSETRYRDNAILGIALLVVGAAIAFDVEGDSVLLSRGFRAPDFCFIKMTTGLSCPSCGMTRAFVAMADGNPRAALDYNPVGPLLFLLVVFQLPFRTLRLVWPALAQSSNSWDGKVHMLLMVGLVAILLAAWSWRTFRYGLG